MKNGWTQLRLSQLVPTTERTIQRWESGELKPNAYHQGVLERLFKKNGV